MKSNKTIKNDKNVFFGKKRFSEKVDFSWNIGFTKVEFSINNGANEIKITNNYSLYTYLWKYALNFCKHIVNAHDKWP